MIERWVLSASPLIVLARVGLEDLPLTLLDDAEARRCARAFAVPIKGTLVVVLLAKQRGLVPSAAEVIQALVSPGFRPDNQLVRDVLFRTVGETWPS